MVYLDPAHQALIDRILGLKEGGLNCRKIAAYLNDEGVTSWTGKRFYPELVFGILRMARLRHERVADVVTKEFRLFNNGIRRQNGSGF